MSTAEILAALARLSATEREQVRDRLDAWDAAAPLSADEQRVVQARVTAYRQQPDASVPWAVAEAQIRRAIRKGSRLTFHLPVRLSVIRAGAARRRGLRESRFSPAKLQVRAIRPAAPCGASDGVRPIFAYLRLSGVSRILQWTRAMVD